jgi:hypothetical protein
MRSAAALRAATTAAWVAWPRSADITLASCIEAGQLFPRLREFVGDRQCGHDREPRVADLTEARAQRCNARIKIRGKIG